MYFNNISDKLEYGRKSDANEITSCRIRSDRQVADNWIDKDDEITAAIFFDVVENNYLKPAIFIKLWTKLWIDWFKILQYSHLCLQHGCDSWDIAEERFLKL